MSADLRWETMPSGVLGCVGTVIWNEASRKAVLIDPTDDPSTFLDFMRERELVPARLLLTHAHYDHAAGACEVAHAVDLPILLHRDDWQLFRNLPDWGHRFGLELAPPDIAPTHVEHGESIEVEDGFSIKVLHTPGHTPGQVAYYLENLDLVVVGDTLFNSSVGRTDLPGGSMPQLANSIRQHLYALPDRTVVVPGHGDRTTIGREKRTNPYVKAI